MKNALIWTLVILAGLIASPMILFLAHVAFLAATGRSFN